MVVLAPSSSRRLVKDKGGGEGGRSVFSLTEINQQIRARKYGQSKGYALDPSEKVNPKNQKERKGSEVLFRDKKHFLDTVASRISRKKQQRRRDSDSQTCFRRKGSLRGCEIIKCYNLELYRRGGVSRFLWQHWDTYS